MVVSFFVFSEVYKEAFDGCKYLSRGVWNLKPMGNYATKNPLTVLVACSRKCAWEGCVPTEELTVLLTGAIVRIGVLESVDNMEKNGFGRLLEAL